ncbi:AI-2E family transporter [Pseudaminobacter sp. 19-2017]|uniref:AI-2E family transporter n=1 Tax=Pseudaminobacter soli (ex Zhang et al. 2022) TaxID=2831468 RepID=A0A942I2D6_9HYPH|nr:AI-2E family transporter [Pseudaminobacter soli]MBS3649502.1 AI-2E family transporter [Pseudaminobacter soli]
MVTDPYREPASRQVSHLAYSSVRRRSSVSLILVALAAGAGLFLAWQVSRPLLLIFAGLLFGAFLDACTRGLAALVPLRRGWLLTIVCLVLALGAAWLVVWGGTNLIQQADSLVRLIGNELVDLRAELQAIGIGPPQDGEAPRTLGQILFPNPGALFGTAFSAFNLASSFLGSIVVVVFIGLFMAASPETYHRGVLSLVPRARRQRIGEVLNEMAGALRWWLVGQLAAGTLIAITTWVGLGLIGMPGALPLGLQAGLLNFIPYLGPVIAGVPIVLAAMAQGPTMVWWALGVYFAIQIVEGYVLTPLIQKRAVDVSPVLTLAAVMVFGALFGALGFALATPLVATLKVAVERLYIEDQLEKGELS